jgi:hypothetical protein
MSEELGVWDGGRSRSRSRSEKAEKVKTKIQRMDKVMHG